MIHYGYIENGYLRSKILEPITERYYDSDGNIKERIISVEEQIKLLPPGYKPVDPIDDGKVESDDDNYAIRIEPYDAGDHISFCYIKVPDVQRVRNEISSVKDQLNSSDYKIIKCYEASLLGDEAPYNIVEVSAQRQALRDRVNELELLKNKLETYELDNPK